MALTFTVTPRCWLRPLALLASVLLPVVPALAQGEEGAAVLFLIPTEVSVGLGATAEPGGRQTSANFNVGAASIIFRDQWFETVYEMGFGPVSDEALCQSPDTAARDDACIDFFALMGVRSHLLTKSDRTLRPFIQFLVGGYWKGSGTEEPEWSPRSLALQTGGGIDIRRARSIHGLRVAGDYRHISDHGRPRHQLQLVVSYFVGSRGMQRRQPPAP